MNKDTWLNREDVVQQLPLNRRKKEMAELRLRGLITFTQGFN